MTALSIDQVSQINKTALARKHKVTPEYVSMVLRGKRSSKSAVAQKIIHDAEQLIKIIQG